MSRSNVSSGLFCPEAWGCAAVWGCGEGAAWTGQVFGPIATEATSAKHASEPTSRDGVLSTVRLHQLINTSSWDDKLHEAWSQTLTVRFGETVELEPASNRFYQNADACLALQTDRRRRPMSAPPSPSRHNAACRFGCRRADYQHQRAQRGQGLIPGQLNDDRRSFLDRCDHRQPWG